MKIVLWIVGIVAVFLFIDWLIRRYIARRFQ